MDRSNTTLSSQCMSRTAILSKISGCRLLDNELCPGQYSTPRTCMLLNHSQIIDGFADKLSCMQSQVPCML